MLDYFYCLTSSYLTNPPITITDTKSQSPTDQCSSWYVVRSRYTFISSNLVSASRQASTTINFHTTHRPSASLRKVKSWFTNHIQPTRQVSVTALALRRYWHFYFCHRKALHNAFYLYHHGPTPTEIAQKEKLLQSTGAAVTNRPENNMIKPKKRPSCELFFIARICLEEE